MKRLSVCFVVLALALGPSACGDEGDSTSTQAQSQSKAPKSSEQGGGSETKQAKGQGANSQGQSPEQTQTQAPTESKTPASAIKQLPPSSGQTPGSPSQKQAAETAVSDYYTALAAGDGPRACSLLAGDSKQTLISDLAKVSGEPAKSCAASIETVVNAYTPKAMQNLAGVQVTEASVTGTEAAVSYTVPGIPPSTVIATQGKSGAWLVGATVGIPDSLKGD